MIIKITKSAYNDINTAQLFYECQKDGLGVYFQDSIFSDISSLIIYAGIHQKQYGKYRLIATKFPYAIYYDILDNIILIFAILDCRRNPKNIQNKLK